MMREHSKIGVNAGTIVKRRGSWGSWRGARSSWILLAVVASMLTATPAIAGVPAGEPSSCNTTASTGWYYSCWVSNNGADPDRISDFSVAIQNVLTYNVETNDDPDGIDGYFGTKSYNATKQFQSNHSLQSDGIVGSNTWNYLQQDLVTTYSQSGYNYARVENHPYNWSEFRLFTSSGVWSVWSNYGGSGHWVSIDRWRS